MRWCLLLALALVGAGAVDVSWTNCPVNCICRWVSGRRAVECTDAGITHIPTDLSSEIQTLDLSSNSIPSLPAEVFMNAGLINLQRLILRNCSITEVNGNAFFRLEILIMLDLSQNNITSLSPFTFRNLSRIRQINLSHNPLQTLDEGVFLNLHFLLSIDLSDCQLFRVSEGAFGNVSKLNSINLKNNNLSTLQVSTFETAPSLVSLSLFDNPWHCNCRLRPFIEWTVQQNLNEMPTVCTKPPGLQGKPWADLTSDDLSCRPRVEVPGSVVVARGANATLPCRAHGDPLPDVHWVRNSRVITNSTQDIFIESKYAVSAGVDGARWLNLTVLGVDEEDVGEYTCVGQSYGGMEERVLSLVAHDQASTAAEMGVVVVSGAGFSLEAWSLVIGLAAGGALALLFVVSLFAFCCVRMRQRRRALAVKSVGGGRLADGSGDDDVLAGATHDEKFPLTTVNPVQKPPRRIDRLSVTSMGTELTEIKSSLLDGGSVYQPSSIGDSEDRLEGRSIDSVDSNAAKSQDGLDAESLASYAVARPYPPDLLSFPSHPGPPPATTHHYHNPYGTLPYSRSHSPLSMCSLPASAAVARPRGYVTVPRRPRVPSWSSPGDPYLQKLSPVVYDKLGPRTTADGSSMLSLNKVSRTSPEGTSAGRVTRDRNSVASVSSLGEGREKVPPRPPPKPRKKSMDIVAGPLIEDEEDDGTEV
ncbi:leucine-rich repeat-containing protein 24-like [Bacillus rossius redtenbacheri]|uniref:leucine-rich repeat-containing protein 24-like n=1 Tax=Bacillus rossius redtenbacheri TaxID=93214 RepID=UPI002FDCC090